MRKSDVSFNGVESFERLRGYLDKIYLFGCYSRLQLAAIQGFSVEHVSKTLKLLKQLVFLETTLKTGKNKSYMISREYESSGQIPLADVYMLRSYFNDDDLYIYLYILTSLNNNEAGYSEHYFKNELKSVNNGRTIAKKLDALESEGYIQKNTKGEYTLCGKHFLSDLEISQLKELYDLIQFASMTTYPRVAGRFLMRTIERELYKKGIAIKHESPYIMRHTTSRNVLDEVLVYQLLFAIEEKKWVDVDGKDMLPIELRIDNRLGRWYCVFAKFVYINGKAHNIEPHFVKLSAMKILIPSTDNNKQKVLWNKLVSVTGYEGNYNDVFNQVRINLLENLQYNLFSNFRKQKLTTITLIMDFDDYDDEKRFENEINRFHVIHCKNPDRTVEYTIKSSEVIELVPLLRSYSPYIVDLSGSDYLLKLIYESIAIINENICKDAERKFKSPLPVEMCETKNTNKGQNRELVRILFSQFQNREFQHFLDFFAKSNRNHGFKETTDGSNNSVKKISEKYESIKEKRGAGFDQPYLPMSSFERDYLRFALGLPEAKLFFTGDNIPNLQNLEKGFFDLDGNSINRFDYSTKDFVYDEDTRKNFKTILDAIKEKRLIKLTFKDNNNSGAYFPWKLEYRGYDRRWWLIYCENTLNTETKRIPLDKLKKAEYFSVNKIENSGIRAIMHSTDNIMKALDREKLSGQVVLRIFNKKNALERCLLAFENFEAKSVKFLGCDDEGCEVFELTLTIYEFFINEFIRSLLRLGDKVQYISGPKRLTEKLRYNCENALGKLSNISNQNERE